MTQEIPHSYDRQSNFELLRIVCMFFILLWHFLIHGIHGSMGFYNSLTFPFSIAGYYNVFTQSLCIVGVNCFILISGYFKIKLSIRSFLSFYFLCLFYNIVFWALHSVVAHSFDSHYLLKCFFISNTGNWFFRSYLWLLIASPFLNSGIDALSTKQFNLVVLLLFFLNTFSGFVLKSQNPDGYGALQFFFIYIVGSWIHRHKCFAFLNKGQPLLLYFCFSFVLFISAVIVLFFTSFSLVSVFAYNNPIIIAGSISLFLFFGKLHVQSKVINCIASTVVAALFLQDVILAEWIYPFVKTIIVNYGVGQVGITIILLIVCLFLLAFVIEYPRKRVSQTIIDQICIRINNVQGCQS